MNAAADTGPTIDCASFREHQFDHRQDPDGTWRCLRCEAADANEPLADQVAAAWDFEGGAA